MGVFSKKKKEDFIDKKIKETSSIKSDNSVPPKVIKKKKKIGFRKKEKKLSKKEKIKAKKVEKIQAPPELVEQEFQEDLIDEEILTELKEENEVKPKTKKKKTFIKRDMKGKPVYLEDTGEKLGAVFDTIYDKDNNIIGYKIKDNMSNSTLTFTIDQFDEDKDGLIFVPGWYTKALKTIEKLEFKDRISPELTALLTDDNTSNKELYAIFVEHDDDMADHIDEAVSLKEVLNNRLKVLERQRLALKDNLMDLTEKRLIKDIDRREFSEDVMEHRRKVNILDVNINKCKELIKRLDKTSFGILGKDKTTVDPYINTDVKIEKNLDERILETFNKNDKNIMHSNKIERPYKTKYYALKEQYDNLEDEYRELKVAVEKLVNKDGL